MKTILKVETKYNENLADAQVLVVTLLSNINRTWDFIVDTDAYHTLRLNEDYLVTTQDDWLGTIVGIRFETVANAINLKATVLKPVPVHYYHNYTNSSSYNRAKKDLKIEYDMDMRRTIIVKDYTGKNVYEYTGSFSYILKGQKIDLTDNKTGEKISVYIGDNNTVIVTDTGIKGEKK